MTTLSPYYTLLPNQLLDSTYLPQFIFSPVTADFNGDGFQDILVLGASYPIGFTSPTLQPSRLFFGNGAGGFTEASSNVFPAATLLTVHPRKVLVEDFNGDGRLDIFISSHGWDTNPFPGEQNRLLLSQPDGSWKDSTNLLPQLSDYSHTAAVGDINQDGKPDIFVGNGYGGQNNYFSYALINNGTGGFTQTTANLPLGPNEILDFTTGHTFPGATITDLDGDGKQDLIITADATASFNKNTHSTVLWNLGNQYSEASATQLPATNSFSSHIDLDVEPIDINGDGLKDLVIVGTQGSPFYDGWFIQLLKNNGNRTFTDVSASELLATDRVGGVSGATTNSPWPMWVKVLDFNHDGSPDFAIEYNGGQLNQSTPLIWLNDGNGHFTTLKVSDFVAPGDEWELGNGHLVETNNGFSFVTPQSYAGSGGLRLTVLLATMPYDGLQSDAVSQVSHVYDKMFGAPPNTDQISNLLHFRALQYNYGQSIGVADPLLYAYQALGQALSKGAQPNKFESLFGSSVIPTDHDFAAEAYADALGHAASEPQVQHFVDQVHYFTSLYVASGAFDPASIGVLARGAVYGQMLGFAAEATATVQLVGGVSNVSEFDHALQ